MREDWSRSGEECGEVLYCSPFQSWDILQRSVVELLEWERK